MSQIVVISGHPELESSNTNKVILEMLANSEHEIDIRRLDQIYPDYKIDIAVEQEALLKADLIILQFPFFWYSVPAIMKKWIDDTFSYNFAYGADGDKLKGKDFLLSFTIGGPTEAYTPTGYNHFPIEELIKPLQQTAYLAGMNYQAPIYSHSMVYIPGVYNTLEVVQERAVEHGHHLLNRLDQLLQSPERKIEQFVTQWFSEFDLLPEDQSYFLSHLSQNLSLQMPEGEFKGHSGFRDWYQIARSTFKPECQHQVEQIEIDSVDSIYKVQLRIRLSSETFSDSMFEGQPLNLLVDEAWQVKFDRNGQVIIESYQVTPVAS